LLAVLLKGKLCRRSMPVQFAEWVHCVILRLLPNGTVEHCWF